MSEIKKDQGLLVRDEHGNTYFLRPEIMDACKVSHEDAQKAGIGSKLKDLDVTSHEISAEIPGGRAIVWKGGVPSTVMCPW